MLASIEIKFARYLAVGLFLVTVLVVAGPVSEPANVPKLVVLGTLAFGVAPAIGYFGFSQMWSSRKLLLVFVSAFIVSAFLSMVFSRLPLTQNFYGVYGRNTGFLTLTCFALILLIAGLFQEKQSFELLIYALMASGIVNIIYGFVNQYIGDPINWNNNYGAFLGTLGNPNFAGAFLGVLCGVYFSFALKYVNESKLSIIFFIITVLNVLAVLFTKTTQGILVMATSTTSVLIIYLMKKLKNKLLALTFGLISSMGLLLTISGILQKGPLTEFLYKRSVSLRGVYWDAAFQTGLQNPLFGVGPDGFADWYRLARSEKAATWLPGPNTITNAAHNYYLDIFASGGFLLLIIYAAITGLGIYAAYVCLKFSKGFDPVVSVLVASFIGFQAQSLISIQQIGLAVWGWVFVGLLYSYSIYLQRQIFSEPNRIKRYDLKSKTESPVGVFIFIGMSLGLLLSVPPYAAEAKWTNALNSRDLAKIESALTPSYFNPENTNKYAQAIYLMEKNKLFDQAYKYTKQMVSYNPDNFDAWRALYYAMNSTAEDRRLALENMKILDPRNKTIEALK